jgi:hypothetical protein
MAMKSADRSSGMRGDYTERRRNNAGKNAMQARLAPVQM